MRRTINWCLLLAVTAALAVAASGGEESVPLDKVPKPVIDAVKARFKDAKLSEASKETEDGKIVYEVTVHDNGQHIDLTLTPDGEILLIEKEISVKDLPKPVTKTLEEKYAKATYKIVEEIIKVEKKAEKLAYYEVLLVTADKKKIEVEISPEGKIIKTEDKSGKDDK